MHRSFRRSRSLWLPAAGTESGAARSTVRSVTGQSARRTRRAENATRSPIGRDALHQRPFLHHLPTHLHGLGEISRLFATFHATFFHLGIFLTKNRGVGLRAAFTRFISCRIRMETMLRILNRCSLSLDMRDDTRGTAFKILFQNLNCSSAREVTLASADATER